MSRECTEAPKDKVIFKLRYEEDSADDLARPATLAASQATSLATAHPVRELEVLEASVEAPAVPPVARSATRFVIPDQLHKDAMLTSPFSVR